MIADAEAAFALIRARAHEWKVDPQRIGMIGFSAGAALTLATASASSTAQPAFLGDIYGPLNEMEVPAGSPPLFVALAADDPLFDTYDFGIVRSWRKAGVPVEFHYYEQGGHGFGMYPKETTSTGWFDAFADWLRMHGFARPGRIRPVRNRTASGRPIQAPARSPAPAGFRRTSASPGWARG